MAGRRSMDSSSSAPAMKIVGFKVDGVPPSPDQSHLLADALLSGGGSPDPVIIPPAFQNDMAGGGSRSGGASPSRQVSIPSLQSEGPESGGIRELLGSMKGHAFHGSGSEASRSSGSQHAPPHPLPGSSSLPPTMGDAAAQMRHYANFGMHSPRHSDQQRETKSNPVSTATTPSVSPYRHDIDRTPSGSHKVSIFDTLQSSMSHPDVPASERQSSEEKRTSMERNRPIQAHMASTYSEGGRVSAIENSLARLEVGTPRLQHGFEIPPVSASASMPLDATRPSTGGEEAQPGRTASVPAVPAQAPAATSTTAAHASPTAGPGPPAEAAGPSRDPASKQAERGVGVSEKAEGEPRKKPTKSERRAIQERQRAESKANKEAEARQRGGGQPSTTRNPAAANARPENTPRGQPGPQAPTSTTPAPSSKPKPKRQTPRRGQTSEMFAHLPQYKAITIENVFEESLVATKVHPAILQLGLQYASGAIAGGNARCLAMLLAFKSVIQDYQTPESKELARDLTSQLNLGIQFLVECRPLSISMGNAIKNLKLKVSQIGVGVSEREAKMILLEEIDTFVQEKVTFADEQVARNAQCKVESGDVVLTFAFSSAVLSTFLMAKKEGKQFRVMVVDSRPHYEGKAMLAKLLAYGIPCTYLHLNALCYSMQEVSKVFMGASGAMSNGTILARVGSGAVAMVAAAMQRPVIICCETLKFADRVQLDSITYNELGDPHALATVEGRPDLKGLQSWQDQAQLELLNLVFDAMPCDYVTLIVTEVGAIPPTSIPVVLREYRTAPVM